MGSIKIEDEKYEELKTKYQDYLTARAACPLKGECVACMDRLLDFANLAAAALDLDHVKET